MAYTLAETQLLKFQKIQEKKDFGVFVLEPLFPGYGPTIGNALRRVLLSSLEGSAITHLKIEGVSHEFSTLKGVKEDVVEIILNLKALRLKLHGEEPVVLKLAKKGPAKVVAGDFAKNPQVTIIDPDFYLATLDKDGKLNLEATVAKGRGYVPTELRKDEKLPLGTIAIDSIFSPIRKVHFSIDNTRVGERTDFNKLTMEITTDGTILPSEALKTACQILQDHYQFLVSEVKVEKPTKKAHKSYRIKTKKQKTKPKPSSAKKAKKKR